MTIYDELESVPGISFIFNKHSVYVVWRTGTKLHTMVDARSVLAGFEPTTTQCQSRTLLVC